MDYKIAKQALAEMETTGRGWTRIAYNRVVTRRDVERYIREMNDNSNEDWIERDRRTAGSGVK